MSQINGLTGANGNVDFRALMLERLGKKQINFEDVLETRLEQQASQSAVNPQDKNSELNEGNFTRYNAELGLYQLPSYMGNAKSGASIIERTV